MKKPDTTEDGKIVSTEFKIPILKILNEKYPNGISTKDIYRILEKDYFSDYLDEINKEKTKDDKGRVDIVWRKKRDARSQTRPIGDSRSS